MERIHLRSALRKCYLPTLNTHDVRCGLFGEQHFLWWPRPPTTVACIRAAIINAKTKLLMMSITIRLSNVGDLRIRIWSKWNKNFEWCGCWFAFFAYVLRMVLNDSVAGVVRATISCRNSTKLLQLIAFGLIEFHLWVKLGELYYSWFVQSCINVVDVEEATYVDNFALMKVCASLRNVVNKLEWTFPVYTSRSISPQWTYYYGNIDKWSLVKPLSLVHWCRLLSDSK